MESNEKTYIFSEKTLDSYVKTVQKIARLEEREACAKLCDELDAEYESVCEMTSVLCSQAIRARGEA
jgi:hypothetical protein